MNLCYSLAEVREARGTVCNYTVHEISQLYKIYVVQAHIQNEMAEISIDTLGFSFKKKKKSMLKGSKQKLLIVLLTFSCNHIKVLVQI